MSESTPETEAPPIDPDEHPDTGPAETHDDAADPDVPDNVGQELQLDDPDESEPPE